MLPKAQTRAFVRTGRRPGGGDNGRTSSAPLTARRRARLPPLRLAGPSLLCAVGTAEAADSVQEYALCGPRTVIALFRGNARNVVVHPGWGLAWLALSAAP